MYIFSRTGYRIIFILFALTITASCSRDVVKGTFIPMHQASENKKIKAPKISLKKKVRASSTGRYKDRGKKATVNNSVKRGGRRYSANRKSRQLTRTEISDENNSTKKVTRGGRSFSIATKKKKSKVNKGNGAFSSAPRKIKKRKPQIGLY